jgi:hypothetical protein
MDWRCGSSGTAFALQAQNPESKPQSHKKKKKKKMVRSAIKAIQTSRDKLTKDINNTGKQ